MRVKVWCWESGQRHPRPAPPHTTADLLSLDCEAARVLEAAGLGAALSERAHVLHRVGVEDDDAAVDRVGDERGDGLLTVVQVHEPADVPLHVRLVARVLELAAQLHHLVSLEKSFFIYHFILAYF